MKAKFDDHVITVGGVAVTASLELPTGTHGSAVGSADDPERYEVECDLRREAVLGWVGPEDFGVAQSSRSRRSGGRSAPNGTHHGKIARYERATCFIRAAGKRRDHD